LLIDFVHTAPVMLPAFGVFDADHGLRPRYTMASKKHACAFLAFIPTFVGMNAKPRAMPVVVDSIGWESGDKTVV
jgi:hypothetical protein